MGNIATKIVLDYINKNTRMPNKTLSDLIFSENQDYFLTPEHVRNIVRYHRGSMGEKNRKQVGFESNQNPFFNLPPSEEKPFSPYILELRDRKILWISDIHIPYHSEMALDIALKYAKDHDVDTILLMGDIIDCAQISKFTNEVSVKNFTYEVKIANHFLDYLGEMFPKAQVIFLEGNHEYRLHPYISIKCPELYGLNGLAWKKLLNLDERGYEFVDDSRLIMYDNLALMHGHEIIKGSGTNKPAEKLYRETKANAICGHLHRTSSHTETNLHGKSVSTYTVGHLSEPHPKYLRYNRWNHGFAIIETHKKDWVVSNLKIINGKVV